VTGRWFSLVSSTNKNYRQDITEILLKVALNTINQPTNKQKSIQFRKERTSIITDAIKGENHFATTCFVLGFIPWKFILSLSFYVFALSL
jgi:hypothetical protein